MEVIEVHQCAGYFWMDAEITIHVGMNVNQW